MLTQTLVEEQEIRSPDAMVISIWILGLSGLGSFFYIMLGFNFIAPIHHCKRLPCVCFDVYLPQRLGHILALF